MASDLPWTNWRNWSGSKHGRSHLEGLHPGALAWGQRRPSGASAGRRRRQGRVGWHRQGSGGGARWQTRRRRRQRQRLHRQEAVAAGQSGERC
ncbi:hypothetical protein PR202_gb07665 [Eleusine coracana subsp. coracana]|uniref:Uncharacterized protein n=1 Tax=Eleusine coracana subsp. coracana TaxID=191504 RepID=A0AAV5EB09_ELECO|nr:hypothetical protein PR202_gb07665 [Eleusine coracana subsp. coracana]